MNADNKEFLISAIVSTYNSEKFIEGKIIDLLNQTIINDIEIIIINSGSQQNEDKIILKYLQKYSNIKYIKTEQRETIYKAWNRGIRISSGKFITNANTDDRLREDALEVLSAALLKNPDVGLVYGDQFITNIPNQTYKETIKVDKNQLFKCPEYNYFHQLDRCLVFSQPMWRTQIHSIDNIWFEETYEVCGDYDFELKLSQKYKMLHIHESLGTFYLSPKNENKSHKNIWNVIDEREKISEPFILDFIKSKNDEELNKIFKKFQYFIKVPIPIFYLWKRICLFFKPSLINDKFFHSIEFIYFFTMLYLEKNNEIDKAIHINKRILKYSKSKRIHNRFNVLLKKDTLGKKNSIVL